MYFQFGVRNWQNVEQRHELNEMSNKHYHLALSKAFHLQCASDLTSLQAIAMIANHARAFPKPGCASMLSDMALQKALAMNLHRETRKPKESTNLDIEMRKRLWWTILTVYVAVNGRCGRPMPITVEEFDVEFPQPIADEFLTKDGVNTTEEHNCPYEIGLAGFKIIPIFIEMYSNLYCVRVDAQNYSHVVSALETQIQTWEQALPERLRLKPRGPNVSLSEENLDALYAKAFLLEFRLCLRHPSATMVENPQVMAENTRICEEVGREMLYVQQQIQRLNSLDTTWYQISVHTAAIFSVLAAHWERRDRTTPDEIVKLREEMDKWLSILEEVGNLIGELHSHELRGGSTGGLRGLLCLSPKPTSQFPKPRLKVSAEIMLDWSTWHFPYLPFKPQFIICSILHRDQPYFHQLFQVM